MKNKQTTQEKFTSCRQSPLLILLKNQLLIPQMLIRQRLKNKIHAAGLNDSPAFFEGMQMFAGFSEREASFMTQHLGSVKMEPKRNEWTCAVLTLRRGRNLLLFGSKDRLSHVHSYANGFIPQKGASSEPGYKEILPNTHTHTHTHSKTCHKHSNKAAQLVGLQPLSIS